MEDSRAPIQIAFIHAILGDHFCLGLLANLLFIYLCLITLAKILTVIPSRSDEKILPVLESIQSFIIRYDISCRFLVDTLYRRGSFLLFLTC